MIDPNPSALLSSDLTSSPIFIFMQDLKAQPAFLPVLVVDFSRRSQAAITIQSPCPILRGKARVEVKASDATVHRDGMVEHSSTK